MKIRFEETKNKFLYLLVVPAFALGLLANAALASGGEEPFDKDRALKEALCERQMDYKFPIGVKDCD